eukprot:gene6100-10107_t
MSNDSPSEQYIQKHKLNDIFEDLMKNILFDKPENPLEYMSKKIESYQKDGFKSSKRRVYFVLGAPGSGKGTQSAKLVKDFGFVHLSAGDLLRAEAKSDSEEGTLISHCIKEGAIVPGHITIRLLKKKIESYSVETQFLIDGFPREMIQCIDFEREINPCQFCLFFDCPLEIVEGRLLERGKTSGRVDDNLEAIIKRFNTYTKQTKPVINYFEAVGRLRTVDTSKDIDTF